MKKTSQPGGFSLWAVQFKWPEAWIDEDPSDRESDGNEAFSSRDPEGERLLC